MWLIFDIGNSAVKAALADEKRLHNVFPIGHPSTAGSSSLQAIIERSIREHGVDRIGYASVVPDVAALVDAHAKPARDVFSVNQLVGLPYRLLYETPDTIGADRLAGIAAVCLDPSLEGRSVVVIDAGTAITYDVLTAERDLLGGAIGAGPYLLQRAIHEGTARLPTVKLEKPDRYIARRTTEAVQAGIMATFLDSVAGMIERVSDELGERPHIVATGGWARLLTESLEDIEDVRPYLVLEGVRILMARNIDPDA